MPASKTEQKEGDSWVWLPTVLVAPKHIGKQQSSSRDSERNVKRRRKGTRITQVNEGAMFATFRIDDETSQIICSGSVDEDATSMIKEEEVTKPVTRRQKKSASPLSKQVLQTVAKQQEQKLLQATAMPSSVFIPHLSNELMMQTVPVAAQHEQQHAIKQAMEEPVPLRIVPVCPQPLRPTLAPFLHTDQASNVQRTSLSLFRDLLN